MNRIYQGRVTQVEVPAREAKGQSPKDRGNLPNGGEALWKRHEFFQDAVNCYIPALAYIISSMLGFKTLDINRVFV